MKKFICRLFFGLLFLLTAHLLIILVYGAVTDWEPAEKMPLVEVRRSPVLEMTDSIFTIGTWNIGFAGLGAESEFFYDAGFLLFSHGKMVTAPRELRRKNWIGIQDFLAKTPADCWLIQEIDDEADRSAGCGARIQVAEIAICKPGVSAYYGENLRVSLLPIPVFEPWNFYGSVRSGLLTASKWQPSEATRWQLPGRYPLPDRLFQLDRCAGLHRFPTKWGRDLVVINIHNSAYDPDDRLKKWQLPYLKNLAELEFQRGNWVVLGGDWNQCPPDFNESIYMDDQKTPRGQGNVPSDFFASGWKFVFDATVPTNRKCREPYQKGKTFVTTIDHFLISPNVKCRSVKCIDLDFQFSDHQPVFAELELGGI